LLKALVNALSNGEFQANVEAGHINQNIALQAVSLDLGSVCGGAFYDEKVNSLVGFDGSRESVIYLQAVGTL
jgi:hypothetical protein